MNNYNDINTNSNNQNPPVRHEINLDLEGLFKTLLGNWKILLICLIIGIALGGVYKNVFVGNLYRADTNIIISDTGSIISINDFSVSSALSTDYIKVITSRTTYEEVIKDLNLNMSYGQLAGIVSVTQAEDSHIYNISATTSDPKVSQEIANSLMNIGMQRVQDLLTECEATVVDPASDQSTINVTPGYRKYVGIGGILGLAIPIIFFLIMHIMDATFKDEDDVEQSLGLPILSRIPYYGDKKNLVTDTLNYYEKEAFNTLYGSITLSGNDIKVIAITSAAPNEGKSSISFKLAQTMTEYGKQVLYIDCDMRNSSFCKKYGIKKSEYPGLSGVLSGNVHLKDAMLLDRDNPNLLLLPPGKNPPNPSVLISDEKFQALIEAAREKCDFVVIDTPPVNAVIDGVYVAKESDAAIIVIESATTDRKLALRAQADLEASDANLIGVIINKIGKKRVYGRKGYGYGRYGYGKGKSGYGYGKHGYGYGAADTGNPKANKKAAKAAKKAAKKKS